MDPGLLAVFRLSKEGFGSIEELMNLPVGIVLDALDYSQFAVAYEEAYVELNKPKT